MERQIIVPFPELNLEVRTRQLEIRFNDSESPSQPENFFLLKVDEINLCNGKNNRASRYYDSFNCHFVHQRGLVYSSTSSFSKQFRSLLEIIIPEIQVEIYCSLLKLPLGPRVSIFNEEMRGYHQRIVYDLSE